MAAALIDRLLHHCHIVNVRGNSYRLRHHAGFARASDHEGPRGSAPTPSLYEGRSNLFSTATNDGLVTHLRSVPFSPGDCVPFSSGVDTAPGSPAFRPEPLGPCDGAARPHPRHIATRLIAYHARCLASA